MRLKGVVQSSVQKALLSVNGCTTKVSGLKPGVVKLCDQMTSVQSSMMEDQTLMSTKMNLLVMLRSFAVSLFRGLASGITSHSMRFTVLNAMFAMQFGMVPVAALN